MIRLSVRAPAAAAEQVVAALPELTPEGVEQVDGDDWVEYALYGTPGELPSLPEGSASVAGVLVEVRGEEVPEDWAERWKRFHVPIMLGGRVYVRPPWEQPAVRPGVVEVVIDPGQAFGTGTHPTTRLCLELMLANEPRGSAPARARPGDRPGSPRAAGPHHKLAGAGSRGSFADLGCGSGVLAIAAAKLGF